jgi:eukaryotic-like serine/threonine-protein kinase
VSDTTGLPGSGRYQLESRIATGGMGEVWRATDQVLGREVALKVLKPEFSDDPTFRSRFETEARNAAALHHPNVASVFDFGELPATDQSDGGSGSDKARPYLVMELVRGEPLSALLRKGEPMPADVAANLVAQAADGLAAAHELGIVHRDVKPANLLVTRDRTVKITDFGIARAADAVALTTTGQVIGTPQYLSPEQAEGKTATGASDIYSLGVVLYECLAGRRPFDAESPIATALAHIREQPPPLPDDVPEAMRRTVETALAKDPADRFESVAELAAALRGGPVPDGTRTTPALAAVEDAPDGGTRVLAPAPVGPATADDTSRRRRGIPPWVAWVAAAIAVALVVLLLMRLSDANKGNDSGGPSKSPSASSSAPATQSPSQTSQAPQTVTVNEGDYVGRPAPDARRDLEDLGLQVQERKVDNPGDEQENTVEGVNPSGEVRKGSTVTMTVYGKAKPTEAPSKPSPPTPSDTASPSTGGNGGGPGGGGNGNGNGNGGGNGDTGGIGGGLDSGETP